MKYLLLLTAVLSGQLQARLIQWDCSTFEFGQTIAIQIDHETSDFNLADFNQMEKEIKSKLFINFNNQTYELENRVLEEGVIEFTSKKETPLIKDSKYTISKIHLFDSDVNSERDDSFFGQMISTQDEDHLYITDNDRFIGPLVRLFGCIKN